MESVESLVKRLTEEVGYKVYDLELPSGSTYGGGTLRVFVCHPDGSPHKVGFDDCATVASRLNASTELDDILPYGCSMEVSSPGVNRKLKNAEHLQGAVGERVRLVVRGERNTSPSGGKKKEVVRGILKSASGDELEIDDEVTKEIRKINANSLSEARVDFKF